MKNDLKYVGKRLIRDDAYDRVRGKTKYVTDIKYDDMLYGKLVLSEKPHANFKFDFSKALKTKGIYKILTYKDVPHNKYNSMEWFTGINGVKDEMILNDRARFVGDRIALVLGDSIESVEEAIKKVVVIYEELPVVATIDDAIEDVNIITGNTNVAYENTKSCGDVEKAFEEADYIVEDEGNTSRTHHLAIETHSAMATVDEFGNLVVSSASQIVFAIQMHLSRILKLPYSKIRVKKSNMGGSFGGKQQPMLEFIAGFVAYSEKRPVQIYMDREQTIKGTTTRNPMRIHIKTAVNKDGKILGRKIDTLVAGGAYATNASSIVNAYAKKLFRLYKIYNQEVKGTAYYTNTLPGGAFRSYGGSQAHAISEINMDNVARKIGMDPCELRLKNLVDPYCEDPVGGPNIGDAGIKRCVIAGMEKINWKYNYENLKNKNTDRYAYGIGMACASHGNGYLGAFPDFINVEMVLNADGNVLCKIAAHEQGCGTLQTLKQVAAEALDLNPKNIFITEADTFITPYDAAGTQASRVSFVAGGALKEASEKLIDLLFDTLNKVKNIKTEDMYVENGFVKIKNSDEKFSYGEISQIREKNLFDHTSVYVKHIPKGNPAVFAADFAQVRVDKKTGFVKVERLVCVHDIGKAINPALVEGQIEGGAEFGIGMALSEDIEIDNRGYVKNSTLSKYHVINVWDMPEVEVVLVETHDKTAPYGIKSVGEISAVAPAPAIINAINHALGTNITNYPATPEKIIEALSEKN
ncbi:MAG: molybdopterin-dependent oxidoreductase [Peptoniphilus sp.]|uniref:xanthine dehydrogenase family protein molybdopterin-binding subunit n=1 Tax=Peptoniphilus sp. TaxID=1971214 RepID=UPI0025FF28DD|nr:molybdopterin cofactor-binding domain-containing protein [Peptoniphilus sp.]MCI5644084.1 molybdopterin-dependent oxidoreductase [Peptoniphilus sp.]MDD7353110.1 molybdopterin-dependent oxidoreductase [Peptoniphilaceae bacterium]